MEQRNSRLSRMVAWAAQRRFAKWPVMALLSVVYAVLSAAGAVKAGAMRLRATWHWRQFAALAMALVVLVAFFPLSLALAEGQSESTSLVAESNVADPSSLAPSDPSDPVIIPDSDTLPAPSDPDTAGSDTSAAPPEDSTQPPEDGSISGPEDDSFLPPVDSSLDISDDSADLSDDSEGEDPDASDSSVLPDDSSLPAEDGSDTGDSTLPEEEVPLQPEEEVPEQEGLVSFLPLDEAIAAQTYPLETPLEDIALPQSLWALPAGTQPESAEPPEGDTPPTEDDMPPDGTDVSGAVEVPVLAWQAEPAYDPETVGDYLFTPSFAEDVLLAEGALLPTVLVTLEEEEPELDTEADMTWDELATAISTASSGAIIIVPNGMAATSTISITSGKSIILKGEGAPLITRSAISKHAGAFFSVAGTLTLQDLILDGSIEGIAASDALVNVTASGSLTIDNGAVLQNNKARGVYVNGRFTMAGGIITNNSVEGAGAGVYFENAYATMSMSSGIISDNVASQNGGGIAVSGGSGLSITGGTITGNSAGGNGGGIFGGYGTQRISGAEISGNSATKGGGIHSQCMNSSGTLYIEGGTTITGNTAKTSGGGVSTAGNGAAFKLILAEAGGVTISGNTSTAASATAAYGAGVVAEHTNLTINSGASITGNGFTAGTSSAIHGGGGVAAVPNNQGYAPAIVKGGSITGNSGATQGLDMYMDVTNGGGLSLSGMPTIGSSMGGLYSGVASRVNINDGLADGATIYLETDSKTPNNFIYVTKTSEIKDANPNEFGAFIMVNPSYETVRDNTSSPCAIRLKSIKSISLQIRINDAVGGDVDHPISVPVWPEDATSTGPTHIFVGAGSEQRHIKLVAATGVDGAAYTRYSNYNGEMFTVAGGSSLTLENITISGGVQNNASVTGAIVDVANGATLKLLGNSALTNNGGRGVYNAGTVIVDGGTISANKSPTLTAESTTSLGGGVYNTSGATFTLLSGTIKDNWATMGGGVYFEDLTNVTLAGGSISGNTAAKAGGGLYLPGTYTLPGGLSITGNKVGGTNGVPTSAISLEGGGVYLAGGTLTLSGATITGNSITAGDRVPARGAGIAAYGSLELGSGTISDNSIASGAATGVGVYATKAFAMQGGSISGNTTTAEASKGGGVYLLDNNSVFTMSGGSISRNKAAFGGGLYLNDNGGDRAVATLENSVSITNNTATGDGGGIYNLGSLTVGDTVAIGGDVANVNSAGGNGGDLFNYGALYVSGAPRIGAPETSGAYIYSGTTPFIVTTNDISGARIYLESANITEHRKVVQRDGEGFEIGEYGKAFRPVNSAYYVMPDNEDATSKYLLLYFAQALPLQTRIDLASGGNETSPITVPVWPADTTKATATIQVGTSSDVRYIRLTAGSGVSGTAFVRNGAVTGPLFQVPSGSSLTLDGLVLDGGGSYDATKATGAIVEVANNGILNITGDKTALLNNAAAGVRVAAGGKFNMSGGTIHSNWGANGAGVENAGAFVMTGGTIRSNIATGNGGGVYVSPTGSLTMSAGTIGGSNTAVAGGGIYVAEQGGLDISGTASITGNTVNSGQGGGIYVSARVSFLMGAGTVSGNIAGQGGGMYNAGTTTINGGSVLNNTAGQGGGGVYNTATINMSSGTLTANRATGTSHGGGIYQAGGTLQLTGGTIGGSSIAAGNTAGGNGGGIYLAAGTLPISGTATRISYNTAGQNGGGAYAAGGTLSVSGTVISYNKATNGAGLYLAPTLGSFIMMGGTVNNNTAGGNGGGLAAARGAGTFMLSSGTFSANAAANGGGLYITSETTTSTAIAGAVALSGNSASASGGGVMVAGSAAVTLGSGTTLDANKAANGGAASLSGGTLELDGVAIGTTAANTVTTGGLGRGLYIPAGQNVRLAAVTFGNNNGFVAENATAAPTITRAGLPAGSIPIEAIPNATDAGVVIAKADSTGYTTLAEADAKAFTPQPAGFETTLSTDNKQVIVKTTVYSITYDNLQDATNPNAAITSYTVLSKTITLQPMPDRTGWRFNRWTSDADGNIASNSIPTGSTGAKKFYAQWIRVLDVTYYPNAGSDTVELLPAPSQQDISVAFNLSNNVPTREDYRFDGWNTKADGGGDSYPRNHRFTAGITKDLDLYAKWVRQYTLHFDGNGGTVPAGADKTDDVGKEITITTAMTPTWAGRTFVKWTTQADGTGTSYTPGTAVTLTGNITLYAQWRGAMAIDFAAGAASVSGMPNDVWLITGNDYTLPENVPTRTDGYRFTGWRASLGGIYSPGRAYGPVNAAVTFTAQWEALQRLEYNTNGGTSATPIAPSAWVVSGTGVAITSQEPTRTGYTFDGWSLSSDGSGNRYRYNPGPGELSVCLATQRATTLYAVWIGAETVTFYPNGAGVGDMPDPTQVRKVTDTTYTLPAQKPTRPDYRFDGWDTLPTGAGTRYAAGQTITVGNSINLHAIWVRQYTLRYNLQGGAAANPNNFVDVIKDTGTTIAIPLEEPARNKYGFTGWNTAANGSGLAYSPADDIRLSADITLYAQWEGNARLVLSRNDGSAGQDTTLRVPTDESIALPTQTPGRPGYRFTSWNTQPDGTGITYNPGATVREVNGTQTLYAQWVQQWTLSYHPNGGSNVPAVETHDAGVGITLSAQQPTRPGHSFIGWNTMPDGSGSVTLATVGNYPAGSQYPGLTRQTMLYAQWQVHQYTLRYSANGGAGAPSDVIDVPWGSSLLVTSAAPTLAGRIFNNWNTAPDGSGTRYEAGDAIAITGDMTLYAQWRNDAFTLSYNAAGGKPTPDTLTGVQWGTEITLPAAPTRTGRDFIGWNTQPDGSGDTYQPGDVFTVQDDTTLTAQWAIQQFWLNYHNYHGKNGPGKITSIPYNTQIKVSSTKPTREGYRFTGWNTAANGSGKAYKKGDTFRIRSNVTLYAQWEKLPDAASSSSSSSSSKPPSSSSASTRPPASSSSVTPAPPASSGGGTTPAPPASGGDTPPAPPASNATPPSGGSTGGSTGGTGTGGSSASGAGSGASSSSSRPSSSSQASSSSAGGASSSSQPPASSSLPASSVPAASSSPLLTVQQLQNLFDTNAVVGQTFTVDNIPLESLVWEPDYFDVTYDADTGSYQFTALQAGDTIITYRDAGGDSNVLAIAVRDADTPLSGGIASWIWILVAVAAVVVVGLVVLLILMRRRRAKKDAGESARDSAED